jgi:hypothetical protein
MFIDEKSMAYFRGGDNGYYKGEHQDPGTNSARRRVYENRDPGSPQTSFRRRISQAAVNTGKRVAMNRMEEGDEALLRSFGTTS